MFLCLTKYKSDNQRIAHKKLYKLLINKTILVYYRDILFNV